MAWPSARYKTAAAAGSWVPGDMNGVQDQYVRAAGIVADDLAEASVTDILGLTTTASGHGGAQVRRGKSIIATEESRSNTGFGLLTTPDQVESVVLPTDGLIYVAYQALWKSSASGGGAAAIFLGANQLKVADCFTGGAPMTQAAVGTEVANYRPLTSCPIGLVSDSSTAGNTSDVTTGQAVGAGLRTGVTTGKMIFGGSYIAAPTDLLGSFAVIFAAAGTYTVSIQYRSTSGSVTVKERKLWVKTESFG